MPLFDPLSRNHCWKNFRAAKRRLAMQNIHIKFDSIECQELCAQGIKLISRKVIYGFLDGVSIAEVVGKSLVRPPDVVHMRLDATNC